MSDQAIFKDDFEYGALRESVKPGSPFDWHIKDAIPASKENADENKKGIKKFLYGVELYFWYALRPWRLIRLAGNVEIIAKIIFKSLDDWGKLPFEEYLRKENICVEELEKFKQEAFRLVEKYKKEGGKL
jgi:hypothetical protein